jgi:hypothetical protein
LSVVAVRRGMPLRFYADGSGTLLGTAMELALNIGSIVLSRALSGWTLGIVSVDREPWVGERVLHREHLPASDDPRSRLAELQSRVQDGTLPIPQPLDWRFRRKPPGRAK